METTSATTPETPKITTTTTAIEGTDGQCDNGANCPEDTDVTMNIDMNAKIRREDAPDGQKATEEGSPVQSSTPQCDNNIISKSQTSIIINDKNAISNCDLQEAKRSNTLETDNDTDAHNKPSLNDNNKMGDSMEDHIEDRDSLGVKFDCHSPDSPVEEEQKQEERLDSGNSLNQQKAHTKIPVDEQNNDEEPQINKEEEPQANKEETEDIEGKSESAFINIKTTDCEEHCLEQQEELPANATKEEKEMFYKEFEEHLQLKPFGDDDDVVDDVEVELETLDQSSQLFEKCSKKEPVIEKPIRQVIEKVTNQTDSEKNIKTNRYQSAIKQEMNLPTESKKIEPKVDAEDSLNPFGEFDSDEEVSTPVPERTKSPVKPVPPTKPAFLVQKSATSVPANSSVVYPKDYNPFGDDGEEEEEEEEISMSKSQADSTNPFGEFDSENEEELQVNAPPRPSPTPTPRTSLLIPPKPTSATPTLKASPQSLRKSPKKSRAPLPPTMVKSETNQSESSLNSTIDSDKVSLDSRTPTPTPRRNKANGTHELANSEAMRMKKRTAPPIPSVKREAKTVSIEDIEKELDQIGDELPGLEQKRVTLEQFLLSTQKALEKEAENDEEYKKKKEEFIEVAKKKCKVSQRQKELMYMKREARLEEQQMDIEFRLRNIMSKQEALKTQEDHISEAAILKELMEVVEYRNDIIENMIRDENVEIQEYIRIIEKVLPEEAKALTPTALDGSKSDLASLKSSSTSKLLKKKTISTLTTLKLKKKKNKEGKDSGEHSGKSNGDTEHPSTEGEEAKGSEKKKKSHFSLGRSTLKKFTSRSKLSSNKENDIAKNEDETSEKPV